MMCVFVVVVVVVCCISVGTELLTSGQQIKSMSLIYKECEASSWVVNEDGLEDYKHLIEEDFEGGSFFLSFFLTFI